MKKYFITAVAALSLGGLFTSCTKDKDLSGGTAQSSLDVQKTYEEAFLSTFGRPVEGLNWGFGPTATVTNGTRALTRVFDNRPESPTFRDGETIGDKFVLPITEPKVPTFYKTFKEVTDAKIVYAEDVEWNNGWDAVTEAYIDENCNKLRSERTNGKTFYVHGDVRYWGGVGNGDNNQPVTFVVLEGSTLHLGCVGLNMRIYLASNAKLDVTKQFDVTTIYNPWPQEPTVTVTEKNWETFSLEKTNAFLYLSKGSKVTGNNLNFFDGCTIRNDGGTIKADKLNIDKKTTLWNNGTVDVEDEIKLLNENAYIYNANNNTISAKNLSLINNEDLIYNNGTLDISEDITITNSSAEIVNNDSLTCSGDFKMTAGGKFHNVGNANITGETYIYNTNAAWMNDGHYTTGSFKDMNCEQVYNNCYMTVTGNFYLGSIPNAQNQEKLGTSNFVNNGGEGEGISGAYVSAGSFTFGDDAQLWVGNKSFIEVDGEFKSTNDDKSYGIHGPSSGSYAVIKAAEFSKEGNPYISMTYYGKLYIDTPKHYPKGTDSANPYYEVNDELVQFSFEGASSPVSIPKTDCSPGYNGNTTPPGPGVDTDATEVMVVAEDLSTYVSSDGKELADFDFNDVVFEVSKGNNSMVHIKLHAAGGTLPLTVGGTVGETELDQGGNEVLKYEVHRLFKVSTGTMVNTNATTSGARRDPVEFDIPYPDGVTSANNIYEIANAIPIRVNRTDLNTGEKGWIEIQKAEEVSSSATRITASKLCVDKTYVWCNERVHIDTVFPYTDAYGNNKGSRFRMYLSGELQNYWWKQSTTVQGQ